MSSLSATSPIDTTDLPRYGAKDMGLTPEQE